jgi:hypothetical protein
LQHSEERKIARVPLSQGLTETKAAIRTKADEAFNHANEAILLGERGNPGCQHPEPEGVMRRGREIDAMEQWSRGGKGRDIREQLLHRGDGVPCVGARAACSRSWPDSKHLFPYPVLSIAMVDHRRRMTHPSGWTCWAGRQWVAELAWAGLPFRWRDRVGWLREERAKSQSGEGGTRREGDRLAFSGFYIVSARRVSRYGIQVQYCPASCCLCFTSFLPP